MRQAGYPVEYRVAAKTLVVMNVKKTLYILSLIWFYTGCPNTNNNKWQHTAANRQQQTVSCQLPPTTSNKQQQQNSCVALDRVKKGFGPLIPPSTSEQGRRVGRKEPSGRESRTNHAESHGLGAAVRKIEGDTPRRARAQPKIVDVFH